MRGSAIVVGAALALASHWASAANLVHAQAGPIAEARVAVRAVPTLSPPAFVTMIALLAAMGFVMLRRHARRGAE